MSYQIIDGGDGVLIGSTANSKAGFFGGIPAIQRTGAIQHAPVNAATGGCIKTYGNAGTTPATVPANSTTEVSFTVMSVTGQGPLAADVVLAVNKVSAQAGLAVCGARVSAANTIKVTYANTTAATMTPTATELYNFVVGSGMPINSVTFSAASIPAATSVEQVITVAPTLPTLTANINAAGQVVSVTVVNGGSGMAVPPTLVFNDGSSNVTATGTAAGLGQTSAPQGNGATAIAILQGGVCVGVQVTSTGSGYTTAPTITCYGGHGIEPGMGVVTTFGSAWTVQNGLGISHSRVVASGQVAVTFFNASAAALTPTASTVYNIAAFNTIPATSNKVVYGINPAGTSVTSASSTEQTVNVYGVAASDSGTGFSTSAIHGGLFVNNARTAADGIVVGYANVTSNWLTPTATDVIAVEVEQIAPKAPLVVLPVNLTPSSVAATTSAEQTFTLPSGTLPYGTNPSTVMISPTQATPGLLMNARVSAANTLAITFTNLTANAITPYSGVYTIESFQTIATSGVAIKQEANPALLSMHNFAGEVHTALVDYGLMRGY